MPPPALLEGCTFLRLGKLCPVRPGLRADRQVVRITVPVALPRPAEAMLDGRKTLVALLKTADTRLAVATKQVLAGFVRLARQVRLPVPRRTI